MRLSEDVTSVFAESCVPPLQDGEYEISVQQLTDLLGGSTKQTQKFVIEGPRFVLQPEDINSVYPPANMKGSFGLSLPHVVFNRKTLPWERSPNAPRVFSDGAAPASQQPWLALILLCGTEILDTQSEKAGIAIKPQSTETFFPALSLNESEKKELCNYIDMDLTLFRGLIPTKQEMTLLSHARKLDMSLKSVQNAEGGWISVLISNRVPDNTPEGVRHRAYVVSLEGFGDFIDSTDNGGYTKARLIVLYQWDFISVTEQLHFKELINGLSVSPFMPEHQTGNLSLDAILKNGYLPVLHELRTGDNTVSFYRGPLSPVPVKQTEQTAWHADSLYKYDPDTGMFDVSYAAAWQQGRLAALHSKSLAVKIMNQRAKNHRIVQSEATRNMLAGEFTMSEGQELGKTLLDRLEQGLGGSL